jgi:hypothetical protein
MYDPYDSIVEGNLKNFIRYAQLTILVVVWFSEKKLLMLVVMIIDFIVHSIIKHSMKRDFLDPKFYLLHGFKSLFVSFPL